MDPSANSPKAGEVASDADGTIGSTSSADSNSAAPSGRRRAFRDLRRELSDEDLKSPGVQKMLIDEVDRAGRELEKLEGYVDRFHLADRRVGVLEEMLRNQNALEILFSVGIGCGCAIIGLAPTFWDSSSRGPLALTVGLVLVIGAAAARIYKR